MLDLQQTVTLNPVWNYSNPRNTSDVLPLVYGDMATGGSGGLWKAVCIDTVNNVYALAGHPMQSVTGLYDSDGALIDPGTYTISLSEDYEGQGVIATASFSTQPPSEVRVRGLGKTNQTGELISNPVDIACDIITETYGSGASESIDQPSLARARQKALRAGMLAAGVLAAQNRLGDVLTDILGEFMGSWWVDGQALLRLSMDLGPCLQAESELAANLRHTDLQDVEVSAELEDVVNQAELYYCLNHATGGYQNADDGAGNAQPLSMGLYGARTVSLELKWVRQEQTAKAVALRFVELLSTPRRTISCQVSNLRLLHLEKGDMVSLSLPWLYDDQGLALVNQIMRVLSVEPQLDSGVMGLSLLDMGLYKTIAYLAGGELLADGTTQAGGRRDRRQY